MNRLRQLREGRNLYQSDIAEIIGVTTSAYSFYENEKRDMSPETLEKLAVFFGVSIDYLLGKNNKRMIPVLGTVKAGYNYLAEENIIDYIEPHMNIGNPDEYFGLVVKGDSMYPYFDDGDYVVVHKTDGCFESGKICVVLINGDEATIKKVIKTDEGIELLAFNPYYPVRKYTFKQIEDLKIQIIGVVVHQSRSWK